MRTILITGVTGFLGSALAARKLMAGDRVVALSRNDPSGIRSEKAVKQALIGMDLDPTVVSGLSTIAIDFHNLDQLSENLQGVECDEFWHIAADMSYSNQALKSSFYQNLTATTHIYKIIEENCLQCERFYYVSTAYTNGFGSDVVPESLHVAPKFVNVYQASKWAAEMSLGEQARSSKLPVTIFRPSIVVGDEKTGWVGNRFGMYGFIEAMIYAKKSGSHSINLELNGEAQNNMIPINRLLDFAMELSNRNSQQKQFEVVNGVSEKNISFQEWVELVSSMIGIKVNIASPATNFDRILHKAIRYNREIAKATWKFETKNMREKLGENYKPVEMTADVYRSLLTPYIEDRLAPKPKGKKSSNLHRIKKRIKSIPKISKELGISIEFVQPSIDPLEPIKTSFTMMYKGVRRNLKVGGSKN